MNYPPQDEQLDEFHPSRTRIPPEAPRSFWELLPRAFIFPLLGRGKFVLIVGAALFAVAHFVLGFMYWIFALLFIICLLGFLWAYLLKIIAAVAGGDDEPPTWPDVTEPLDDIFRPLWLVVVTFTVILGPAIGYALANMHFDFFSWTIGEDFSPQLFMVLLGAGLAYLPMSLLAVGLYDSVTGLSPLIVIPAILRVLPAYVATCVGLVVAIGLRIGLTQVDLPLLIGPLLNEAVSLYFLMMEMYLIGIIYRAYEERLGWFPKR